MFGNCCALQLLSHRQQHKHECNNGCIGHKQADSTPPAAKKLKIFKSTSTLDQGQIILNFFVLPFGLKLLNTWMKFGDFIGKVFNGFSLSIHFFSLFFQLSTILDQRLILFLMLEVLLSQSNFFGLNLLLQLVDLVINDLISSPSLSYLILCFW